MAETASTTPAPAPTVPNYFVCCISLYHEDRIRLISLPPPLIPVIRIAIQEGWSKPIQMEKEFFEGYEFKLKGYPWASEGTDTVMTRRLLVSILKAMARNGWNVLVSGDMSKYSSAGDTLFFESAVPDPDPQIFSISFNLSDRIRVIDAPSMMPHVKRAVESQWPKGIKDEREYYGSLELKVNGDPWTSGYGTCGDTAETVDSKLVLAQIISNLRTIGFKLYASIDVTCGTRRDLESFFFRSVGPSWQ